MVTKKNDMKEWLRQRNIPFSEEMLKAELYSLIKIYKPRYKTYEIDKIMTGAGHSVLRLPPYHPDLNPIELVWGSLKQYVAERNVDFNFKHVEKYCDQFFSTFSKKTGKKGVNMQFPTSATLLKKSHSQM
nr:unnamed protein product [Callosobruchus chinensis]